MRMAITPELVSLEEIEKVCQKPIDALQLRRKNLSDRDLYSFAKKCRLITKKYHRLFILNERFDIALLIGADGVHLPQYGIPAAQVKKFCPNSFLLGVSTHHIEEVFQAEKDGVSYVTFSSPIKGNPPNPFQIRLLTHTLSIPILALGAIDNQNFSSYLTIGASGYGAIRMFFSL